MLVQHAEYPPAVDLRIATLAARQHGVVTRRQLLALGVSGATIDRRVQAGRLHRVHTGVFAVGHPALSREGRWLSSVLAVSRSHEAALGYWPAAHLWGVVRRWYDEGGQIDVIVQCRTRGRRGVRVHESTTLVPEDVTTRNGIPVTSVARTLLDLGDVIDGPQLANLMHEAAFRGLLDVGALRSVVGRNCGRRRATATLLTALDLHESGSAGTRSSLEDRFLRLVTGAGIEAPLVNVGVPVRDGVIEVDFSWPARRLCVEVDGVGHRRPRSRRDDAVRDERLREAGWRVIRATASDLWACVSGVSQVLGSSAPHVGLGMRGWRPEWAEGVSGRRE